MDRQYQVALLDADYLIYHAAWASRDMPQMGPTTLRSQLSTFLERIAPNVQEIALYATSKEPPAVGFIPRSELYTIQKYKGNRKDDPAIASAKEFLREALMEWCVSVPGYEADDLIYTAHKLFNLPEGTLVVSTDKDLDQIPGWHYNPVKNKEYYVHTDEAIWNYWSRVLTGDSTDNIRGVPGCGPVTARRLLSSVPPEDLHKTVSEYFMQRLGKEQGTTEFDITMRTVQLWHCMAADDIMKTRPVRILMSEL